MKCPYCGAKNPEDSVFCASCGFDMTDFDQQGGQKASATPAAKSDAQHVPFSQNRPTRRKPRRRRRNNKAVLLTVAVVVCLVIGIAVLTGILRSNRAYQPYEHNILIQIDNGKVAIVQDDQMAKLTDLEAKRIQAHQASLDGSTVAFLTDKGDLALIRNRKLRVVAENVTSFVLSVDGTGLGYVTKSAGGKEYGLKLYNVKTRGTKEVTYQQSDIKFDLAPDGDSVAYYVQNEDQREISLFFFNGKKNAPICESAATLVGLSNDGKQIYTIVRNDDGDKLLYSFNEIGERNLIGPCSISVIYLNQDHSQILFYNATTVGDEKAYLSYISTKGGSGESVISAGSHAAPLIPGNCMNYTSDTIVTLPINNLYNKVYTCWGESGQELWMIQEDTEDSVRLADSTHSVKLSENGEYVYYKTSSDWYSTLMVLKVKDGAKASEKALVLAENVRDFVITSDSKKVYYQAEDGIYCVNGTTGKGTKTVATGQTQDGLFLNDKNIAYFMIGDTVYASKNGKEGKKIFSRAETLKGAANGIVYIYMKDDSIYATVDTLKPTLVWFVD